MSAFYVLDVPEFASLLEAASKNDKCRINPKVGNYYRVEFSQTVEILRSETKMNEAVWYGCLTAGIEGKISQFDSEKLLIVETNELNII